MAVDLFANAANTTLSVAIGTAGATSFTVTSGVKFPTVSVALGTQFRVIIDSELFIVTDSTTTTWTVTPAAEGTTAATHLVSAPVTAISTAGALASKVDVSTLATQYGLTPTAVKTGAYTAVAGDLVLVDPTSAAVPIALTTSPVVGAIVGFKKSVSAAGSTITVTPGGAGTIDGDATAVIVAGAAKGTGAVLKHSGGNAWQVVGVTSASGPVGPTGPAGGIGTSPATTKGDLAGFSTVSTRVPVGTDGQVLTADSVAALGVSYKTPTGGAATFSGAKAYASTGQAIPVTTATTLTWDTDEFVTDSIHTPGTNPTRLTIPTTGYWMVGYEFGPNASSGTAARFFGQIVKNVGAALVRGSRVEESALNPGQPTISVAVPVQCVAGDYFQAQVYSGYACTIDNSTAAFFAYKIGV